MIVTRLFDYISKQGTASQANLAQHFGMSEDGVDAMLEIWIQKGKLSRLEDIDLVSKKTRIRYTLTRQNGLAVTVKM
ncbi:FeoC-like transcriptional regulator [Vibrio sp. FNV 38]|nr:FeoC-like transcriptional regulator [Vibrio sp. FNV 38]